MIPREEWLSILEAYSAHIWPAQIVFYLAAILLTGWFFLKPGRGHNWFIKLYLSIAFAWNGIVWFLILAKDMAGDPWQTSRHFRLWYNGANSRVEESDE